MGARNIYHDAVVHALEADGWVITHDPFRLSFGIHNLYVDLGAERVTIGAERGKQKIAVEVQSFLSPSEVHDLELAVGQFVVYRTLLEKNEADRVLYLAVPVRVYEELLADSFGQLITTKIKLKVLVFDHKKEQVVQWIS
jgi:hypothetical protein